jgi:ribosomal protein S3AE
MGKVFMGQQKVKEKGTEEKVEKKGEEKVEEKPKRQEKVVKRWKGKDWFTILAPEYFGENVIAETPATDPKTIIGRTVEVNVSDLIGQKGKDYQKIRFRADRVDGKKVHTSFCGYFCIREYISRVVRKRLQKIEIIDSVKTKDEWVLQVSSVAIMNRNVDSNVQKKVRVWMSDQLGQVASRSAIDEFVKFIIAGTVQHKMKKQGSRIYPVRFFEIAKIEVLKSPGG